MQQYNKEQLTGKSLDELRAIAAEYSINSGDMSEIDLVYEILEEQAKAAAEKSTAKSTATRKRTRIQKVDRVYTANQEKAKKVDKTVLRSVDGSLFNSLSDEEKALMAQTQEIEKAAAKESAEAQAETADEAPKKKTRKTSTKSKKAQAEEPAAQEPQPQQEPAQEAEPQPSEDTNNQDNKEAESDFIIEEMKDVNDDTASTTASDSTYQQNEAEPVNETGEN